MNRYIVFVWGQICVKENTSVPLQSPVDERLVTKSLFIVRIM
jgi:hypothetical protein